MVNLSMRADGKQMAGAEQNLKPLLGTWFNSLPRTDYIAKIVISEKDGALLVRSYGAVDGEPYDWGETEAIPYAVSGTTKMGGFYAHHEVGPVHTSLFANEKLGVLVIQSYTSFHDDSGRLSHYSREFFHHSSVPGVAGLSGRWVNTKPDTVWISEFTFAERDGGAATMRVVGAAEPFDWGEADASAYVTDGGELAFHAVFDLGHVDAVLAAYPNKGLIIIAAFLRFKGETEPNFLCREFFYREE